MWDHKYWRLWGDEKWQRRILFGVCIYLLPNVRCRIGVERHLECTVMPLNVGSMASRDGRRVCSVIIFPQLTHGSRLVKVSDWAMTRMRGCDKRATKVRGNITMKTVVSEGIQANLAWM
jgi:hypothetical protein